MRPFLRYASSSLVVLLATALACSSAAPPPTREVRAGEYSRLAGGLQLGYSAILAELYADTASTTWGQVTATGLDDISQNWKRILTGARVEQVVRIIAGTSTAAETGVVRDSGRIVLRLKDSVHVGLFRDTTMSFVTLWGREHKLNRWVILTDSIRP